jgi:hypothetical protein
MAAFELDKGWLAGAAGAYVLLNSITALRVAASTAPNVGFDVDALVQGNWVTIATFDTREDATTRLKEVLKEMKHLFRYNS